MLNEEGEIMKHTNRKVAKILCIIIAFMFAASTFAGCAAKRAGSTADGSNPTFGNSIAPGSPDVNFTTENEGASQDKTVTTTSGVAGADKGKSGNPPVDITNDTFGGHKIIQSGELVIETLTFEESVKKLTAYVESIKGFIQSEDVQGKGTNYTKEPILRTGSFVFRVPSNKFSPFFTKAGDFGAIRNQLRHGEDISDQYSDTETKLATLKIREERLQSLMKKAIKLADIIQIERELQTVAYEIDSLTGSLKKWDSLVSFSTISVTLREVAEATVENPTTKATLGERMLFQFKESIKGIWEGTQTVLITLTYLLPYLVILIVIGIIVLFIFRKARGPRKESKIDSKIEKESIEEKKEETKVE